MHDAELVARFLGVDAHRIDWKKARAAIVSAWASLVDLTDSKIAPPEPPPPLQLGPLSRGGRR